MESINETVVQVTPNELTVNTFTKEFVKSLGSNIKMTDVDEENKLELYCYVNCDNNSSADIKKCRGVVFDEVGNVVVQTFPYTPDLTSSNTEEITGLLTKPISSYTFYEAEEGAMIRMFYYKTRWYISTHRKLDAFKSKWASDESFGTMFKKSIEYEISVNEKLRLSLPDNEEMSLFDKFKTILDKDRQYVFIVLNTINNRIVCIPPTNPTVYHVSTFVKNIPLQFDDNEFTELNIPHPIRLTINSFEKLYDYVDNINIERTQGVMVFENGNVLCKITNPTYQEFFNVRGNEPSIKYRYLQIRMNRKMTEMLYNLYSDKIEVFDKYENILYDIACKIFKNYKARYINKEYITAPPDEYNVMKECHSHYMEDRENNKIYIDTVIDILNKQTPTQLNKMIRQHEQEAKNLASDSEVRVSKRLIPVRGVGGAPPTTLLEESL